MKQGPLAIVQHSDLPNAVRSANQVTWIGVSSFEARSAGSLMELDRIQVVLDQGILLEYKTEVLPPDEEQLRRAESMAVIKAIAPSLFENGLSTLQINAYASLSLWRDLQLLFDDLQSELIIFDVTCMTRLQVLALSSWLSQRPYTEKWIIAYTIPESYTVTANDYQGYGWRDVIVSPVAERANLVNESQSRGVIFLGHESDRLAVALGEIEPSGGAIIAANTPGRPDFRVSSEERNERVIDRLRWLKTENWTHYVLDYFDIQGAAQIVNDEVNQASASHAPVILYPFGPKSLLFSSGFQLAQTYADWSWFVYPVPRFYHADYSERVGRTIWFGPNQLQKGARVDNPPPTPYHTGQLNDADRNEYASSGRRTESRRVVRVRRAARRGMDPGVASRTALRPSRRRRKPRRYQGTVIGHQVP